MKVRVLRSWDGIPVGEVVSMSAKRAYAAVVQGRAEYAHADPGFVELRLVKEWQGLLPGTIIERSPGVASVLIMDKVAELVNPPIEEPETDEVSEDAIATVVETESTTQDGDGTTGVASVPEAVTTEPAKPVTQAPKAAKPKATTKPKAAKPKGK